MKDSRLNRMLSKMSDVKEVIVTEAYWTEK